MFTYIQTLFKNLKFCFVLLFMYLFFLFIFNSEGFWVFSTSSTDYIVDPENAINSFNQQSTSTDYTISCQQVGDLAIG